MVTVARVLQLAVEKRKAVVYNARSSATQPGRGPARGEVGAASSREHGELEREETLPAPACDAEGPNGPVGTTTKRRDRWSQWVVAVAKFSSPRSAYLKKKTQQ
ncbi:hypothetical protein ACOSQ3_004315 [Xanthoceras sorbifolium]